MLSREAFGEEVMKRQAVSSWALQTSLTIAVGIMLLSSSPVHAQVDTGTILGQSRMLPERYSAAPP